MAGEPDSLSPVEKGGGREKFREPSMMNSQAFKFSKRANKTQIELTVTSPGTLHTCRFLLPSYAVVQDVCSRHWGGPQGVVRWLMVKVTITRWLYQVR